MQVIDGQQRLKTIRAFFEGSIEVRGHFVPFKLTDLAEGSPYEDKTFHDIKDNDAVAFERLKDAVLRSFVVEQLEPKDTTSIYHIFERLNTGGTRLVGQEIRNCIYNGPLNDFLNDINTNDSWRKIFGKQTEDARMRDVELILRFFALMDPPHKYVKPMKTFLNDFMRKHQNATSSSLEEYRRTFTTTVDRVLQYLGTKPFHISAGFNAAVFDAVFIAFAGHNSKPIPRNIKAKYTKLKRNPKFIEFTTTGTTDEHFVRGRLKKAKSVLFG